MATNGGIPVLPQDLNQFVPVAVLDNDAKTLEVVVKQMARAQALSVDWAPLAGVDQELVFGSVHSFDLLILVACFP